MVEYECIRCGYTTPKKSSMRNHLKRKRICNHVHKNIELSEKVKKEILKGKKLIIQLNDAKKEIEKLKKEKETSNTINNTTNNSTTNNNNITNNTINIQININSFKNPSLKHISEQEILEYIRDGNIFEKIFPKLYLDKDVPENHSIIYTNNRSNTLKLFDKNEYKSVSVDKAKQEIDQSLCLILDNMADEWGEKDIHEHEQEEYANQYNKRSDPKIKKEQMDQWLRDAYDKNYITVSTMKEFKKQIIDD